MQYPNIIRGGSHTDQRGTISFMNDFNMTDVKRAYIIFQPDINSIRAWRAHKIEQRWFHALDGQFLIHLVKIDNWEMPDKNTPIEEFILSAKDTEVLHIPTGYGSSIQALKENSKLIVFADYGIENAALDDYLYPSDYFKQKNNK